MHALGNIVKLCTPDYLVKVEQLSEEEKERLLSRMSGKLPRRLEKDKLSIEEALAIQLELEDEQLQEWRNRMSQLRQKAAPEKKTDEAEAEPKAETPKPETKAKGKPKKKSASPDQ